MKLARFISFSSSSLLWLSFASNVLAGTEATGAGKGGTSGALPAAGSTEITYLFLLGGILIFAIGFVKLVFTYRD